MNDIQVDLNDMMIAMASQRNAALDEIVKQAGIIKALQRELENRPLPVANDKPLDDKQTSSTPDETPSS